MEQQAEDDFIYGTDEYFQSEADAAGLGYYTEEEDVEEEEEEEEEPIQSAAEMTEEEYYDYEKEQMLYNILDQEFDEEPTDDIIEEVRNISPISAANLEARKAYKASNIPANGKQLFAKFVKRGENPTLIAGLLGNAMVESSLNPGAIGDNGTSEGLFQWHNDRRNKLREHMSRKPQGVSDAEWQVDYALIEMKRDYPKVYAQASLAKTPSDAAYIIAKGFEKPKVISPKRMSNAEGFLMQYGGLSSLGTGFGSSNTGIASTSMSSIGSGLKNPVSNSLGYTPTGNIPYSNPSSTFKDIQYPTGDMPVSSPNSSFAGAQYKPQGIPTSDLNSIAKPMTVDGSSKKGLSTGSPADKAAAVVDVISKGISGYKEIKSAIGQGTDAAVTGISSILGEKQNQRNYLKSLEKLYGEGTYGESPLNMQLKQKTAYAQYGY